jgi:tRNA(Glu) U13 pseudouridine synthase TruD
MSGNASLIGAWLAGDRVQLGDLLGNRFTIRVRKARDGADDRVTAISTELGGRFPNYFGEQRFGSSRQNTHLIGEKLLQGKAAALDVELDKGHIVLLGFRPQWRGQSFGTFRVVFNAALYAR